MSARRTRIEIVCATLVAVGLFAGLWLTEPQPPMSVNNPEAFIDTASLPPSTGDDNPVQKTSRLPVVKPAGSISGIGPSPHSASPQLPPTTLWPDSSYTEDEYSLTKIQVYRKFQAASEQWTVETYDAKAARADELSGREIYELYTYLRACHQQPRSVETLDRQVQRIRGSERLSRRVAPEDIEAMVDGYQRRLIRCESLPEDRALEPLMLDWLTLSASRGFPQAQIAYHRSARWLLTHDRWGVYRYPERVRQYQRLAPAFLEAALESGHHDALYEYSLALRENVIFDEDPVASYAYAVAADMASSSGNREAREIMALLETVLEPDDIRDARLNGRELCATHCRPGPA